MRKNLYFRNVIRRENVVKKLLLQFFQMTASYPRLMLEVFIRKYPGQRAINIASILTVAFMVAVLPVLSYTLSSFRSFTQPTFSDFLMNYATWYVFLGLFLYHGWQRLREIKHSPSSFDFTKFSLYAGDINPWFYRLRLFGKTATARRIETMYEPGVFLIGGLVLWLAGQSVGILICTCAISYSLSYVSAYWQGDNFILDRIDEITFNEEMTRAFVDDMGPDVTRGVRFYARKPSAKSLRKKVADTMQEHSPGDAAEVR